jgi:hypothetical protein
LVSSTGGEPFVAITDGTGGFLLPAGAPGSNDLILGIPADPSAGIALYGVELPEGPLPGPISIRDLIVKHYGVEPPPDLAPCNSPAPQLFLDSAEQHPTAGFFKLSASGPVLHTRVYSPPSELYEPGDHVVLSAQGFLTAIFSGQLTIVTSVLYATVNPATGDLDSSVAAVNREGVLSGVAAGEAIETATVNEIGFESFNGYYIACQETGSTYLPVTVQLPLGILPPAVVEGELDVPYAVTLEAAGGWGPPYSWGVAFGGLPPGLNLVGDAITGTPTTSGSSSFTLYAADANQPSTVATFETAITIAPKVTITTTSLPDASLHNFYSQPLSAVGGKGPYKWGAVTPPPSGLVLSEGGVLTGTPTIPGTYSFTANVTDALSGSATATLTLTINGVVATLNELKVLSRADVYVCLLYYGICTPAFLDRQFDSVDYLASTPRPLDPVALSVNAHYSVYGNASSTASASISETGGSLKRFEYSTATYSSPEWDGWADEFGVDIMAAGDGVSYMDLTFTVGGSGTTMCVESLQPSTGGIIIVPGGAIPGCRFLSSGQYEIIINAERGGSEDSAAISVTWS